MCSCIKAIHRTVTFLVPKVWHLEGYITFHVSKTCCDPFKLKPMGSFTSAPKILNEDTADNDLFLPSTMTWTSLRLRCEEELQRLPPRISRPFLKEPGCKERSIRVMQWNSLSQALAISSDKFVACPLEALSWKTRRWRLLEEIASLEPDILCLQEVDHFNFFKNTLHAVGFKGVFVSKPDSPCYYIPDNNGPDGCAIFINESKFDLLETKTRTLEIWGYHSNQVALLCQLREKKNDNVFWIVTTHLKARRGPFISIMRQEQGKDLIEFVKLCSGQSPVILTGDFNAIPNEPVYHSLTNCANLQLDSAYKNLTNQKTEPLYTTWKIREDGEYCETLDYIFFTNSTFKVDNILQMPTEEDIGEGRVPSCRYPSDHFSLVADFAFS